MSRLLRLIAEDPSDVEVLTEILRKKSIFIQVENVLMPNNLRGINHLPQELPKLIATTRAAYPDDAIAVLIDAEWYKPKQDRFNHKQIAALCRRNRTKLLWAVQEIEAWILADSGICAWLDTDLEQTDHLRDPKEKLRGLLYHKGFSLRKRDRRRVFQEMRGDGDQHNRSLGRVLLYFGTLV